MSNVIRNLIITYAATFAVIGTNVINYNYRRKAKATAWHFKTKNKNFTNIHSSTQIRLSE